MALKKRLTVGMRVRILTLKELSKRKGKRCSGSDYYWNREYGGRHALLEEREAGNNSFSILAIDKKWTDSSILPKNRAWVIDGGGAWVPEDVMEFVNANFKINMDYIDWYQENKYNFCGDCGEWFPKRGSVNEETKKDYRCPNKKCPGARWDNSECPECGTKLSGKYTNYCRKCKDHIINE